MVENSEKAYRGMAMEGSVARWYTRTRGTPSQIQAWRDQAQGIERNLPPGATVLEVAPGPGYFAIELARSGKLRVTGLDVSQTFVDIARQTAGREGVALDVRVGDASGMPFPSGAFDLVICQAAFKNFSRPQAAVDEMYRVLKPTGVAQIEDMRADAPDSAIRAEVRSMQLTGLRAWMTYRTLRGLRRRAYLASQFAEFARKSGFVTWDIVQTRIGLEVRMRRLAPDATSVARAA